MLAPGGSSSAWVGMELKKPGVYNRSTIEGKNFTSKYPQTVGEMGATPFVTVKLAPAQYRIPTPGGPAPERGQRIIEGVGAQALADFVIEMLNAYPAVRYVEI